MSPRPARSLVNAGRPGVARHRDPSATPCGRVAWLATLATRDETTPTHLSRVAAASSLLLGLVLVAVLPVVAGVASYVGVLAAASAVLAIVTGYFLWSRATVVVRAVAAFAAGATLAVELLQVFEGLPGARELGHLTLPQSLAAGSLAIIVLVLLLVDARRRRPEQAPDHPYAL